MQIQKIYLSKSTKPNKKYMVKIDNKTIHFGSEGMSDYTIHNDDERKNRYIARHQKRENWNRSGLKTAGFWSYHLLWSENTLNKAIKNTEDKFNIKIIKQLK